MPVIRRVKLIVRAPEPVYTNPKQKPSPPTFEKSITSALASYTRLENDDVDETVLDQAARERAALLERVYALRQQGRMLLSAEDAGSALQRQPTDPRTPGSDPWDHVLDAIRVRQRETSGPEITATIAAKVRTYWDLQNAKEGRVRVQHEKQLRALAKSTLKLVVAEWKKAIFVSGTFASVKSHDGILTYSLSDHSTYESKKGSSAKRRRHGRAASTLTHSWTSLGTF